ncbi:MAG: hypothetical protein AABZ67_04250 [Pseudomonadota bacterium]
MEPADSIVRLGFHSWYERQLIESHAYLVSCLLCAIAILACVEDFSLRAPGLQPLIMLTLISAIGILGYYSCARYIAMLSYAEHIAEKSTCENCRVYAAFAVTGSGSIEDTSAETNAVKAQTWMAVRCRKCGHEWTIR